MFGKLSLEAVPFHEPIVMVTLAMIALGGIAVVGLITLSASGRTCGLNG